MVRGRAFLREQKPGSSGHQQENEMTQEQSLLLATLAADGITATHGEEALRIPSVAHMRPRKGSARWLVGCPECEGTGDHCCDYSGSAIIDVNEDEDSESFLFRLLDVGEGEVEYEDTGLSQENSDFSDLPDYMAGGIPSRSRYSVPAYRWEPGYVSPPTPAATVVEVSVPADWSRAVLVKGWPEVNGHRLNKEDARQWRLWMKGQNVARQRAQRQRYQQQQREALARHTEWLSAALALDIQRDADDAARRYGSPLGHRPFAALLG